jgi:tetratricopeptide (TPR) repeat protein
MALHVFVVMPFGVKDGIDFDAVYAELVKPALSGIGLEVFRADEELLPGDIRDDMFQELLLADLVVADISIDNPNVWYELGVRHALRARGAIHIRCRRDRLPFDVAVDRTLRYSLGSDGRPDPSCLSGERDKLAKVAQATVQHMRGARMSPVYSTLQSLREPDWKELRVGHAQRFWQVFEDWDRRMQVARRTFTPGDVILLAEETPTNALALESYLRAARVLRGLGRFAFALEQADKALALDDGHLPSRREKGLLLSRLKRHDAAEEWLKDVLADHPRDAESHALIGRVRKEAWVNMWRTPDRTHAEQRDEAALEAASLRLSVQAYLQGFRCDPTHYYSGINALTLAHLLTHLTGSSTVAETELRNTLGGAVRFSLEAAQVREADNFYLRASLAELELVSGQGDAALEHFRAAIALAVADKDWFSLDSAAQQLQLLGALDFHADVVAGAEKLLARALERVRPPAPPRQVFLFSGHMVDKPERAAARFPDTPETIARAREAIAMQLAALDAGPEDLAICGGACGGDLVFADAARTRGLTIELRLPYDEPTFLERSVSWAGPAWRDLYFAVKESQYDGKPQTRVLIMPDRLGPSPEGRNAYERCNLWMLYTALAWEPERVRFLCLWNGRDGDGPGGTRHMFDAVNDRTGKVYPIYTESLFGLPAGT